ncbi:MAG TPA: AraC family transcriptional regulator [bacterium]|jgi:AraC-like DNA-binding protein|nr:AraC family transcriptional regulator [bacterium]
MDILTEVLGLLRLQNLVYGRLELSAPWGLEFPNQAWHVPFYIVARGSCVLGMEGSEDLPISAGDMVFLPHGGLHTLKDVAGSKVKPAEQVVTACFAQEQAMTVQHGGGGAETLLLGGLFRFESGAFAPFVRSLPDQIHLKGDGSAALWLEAVRQQLLAETLGTQPGAKIMVSRLADVLFIQALRAHINSCKKKEGGWLLALQDANLGAAITRIHQEPGKPWTVESLAEAAGMSRSAFAARFAGLVGEGPLAYLTRWRMDKAAELLKNRLPVAAVAKRMGYASIPAFSRAFKRHRGTAPGALRKEEESLEPHSKAA